MKLNLTRPLAFLEIQATALEAGQRAQKIKTSRIEAIGILRVDPDGAGGVLCSSDYWMTNPLQFDPASAEADGRIQPTPFAQIATPVRLFLDGCDLAGFNLRRFDLPLLAEEFARAGHLDFPEDDVNVVDVQTIFHAKERRDLASAVRFYLDKEHTERHAAGDALLTWQVFQRQLERYDDLPGSVSDLAEFCGQGKDIADFAGLLYFGAEGLTWNFGKHKDKAVSSDASYATWFLNDQFPVQSQRLVAEAVDAFWFLNNLQESIEHL